MLLAEVGPEEVGEIELGVGHLPEEEVADAQLAAGANQQVGVGHIVGSKIVAQCILVDVVLFDGTVGGIADDAFQCLGNFPPRTVAEGQRQGGACVSGGCGNDLLQRTPRCLGQPRGVAHHAHTDIVLHQRRGLLVDGFDDELHKSVDLGLGAVPVLGREGVERQEADVEAGSGFDRLAHGLRGVLVPKEAYLRLLLRPAAVAVHNDGHVARYAAKVYIFYFLHLIGFSGYSSY